jgi:uracil-DNA glycosylase family 4
LVSFSRHESPTSYRLRYNINHEIAELFLTDCQVIKEAGGEKMSTEQPGLFAGLEPEPESSALPEAVELTPAAVTEPFLAGVDLPSSFPEVSDHQQLTEIALKCDRCHLRATCKQVVFADGPPTSRIMFIGEGPGKDEDIQGRPFVGRAGQLLDKILVSASFKREEVYITNVVKCRPPENRLPNPNEVSLCRNYLEAQIRIIRPAIIVCLGSLASQVVIDPKARITKIRGQWLQRQGTKIIATFHPAALLRNEGYKRPTWEDFKKIRDEYQRL